MKKNEKKKNQSHGLQKVDCETARVGLHTSPGRGTADGTLIRQPDGFFVSVISDHTDNESGTTDFRTNGERTSSSHRMNDGIQPVVF